MIILEIIAWVLGVFGIVGTLMPFIPYDDWWIRDFDYPRMQLLVILGIASLILLVSYLFSSNVNRFLLVGCLLAMGYQAFRILPYTQIWTSQVQRISVDSSAAKDARIRLMMSNVLQSNTSYQKVIDLVHEVDPDILLTLETNKTWENELNSALSQDYPYAIKVPLENRYGMHLYSRFKLKDEKINYLISDSVPSIFTKIQLPNEEWVDLYGVHPPPPSPSEENASTGRDAELALVGELVEKKGNDRTIVAGDLNDVAWSHSTRLFQRVSGLLDPRRGRGFYATFHADYWFMRWPLDHVFHSTDFGLIEMQRLPHVGSDHFPITVELQYAPQLASDQEALKKQEGDEEEAEESVEHGKRGAEDTVENAIKD